jgi:O-antigen ligase
MSAAAPAPRAWSYGSGLFAAIFVLCACAGYIGPRGAPVVLGVGFLAALPLIRVHRPALAPILIALAFVAWAAISLMWSPSGPGFNPLDLERFTAFKLLIQLVAFAGLALAALRLAPAQAERASLAMAFAAVFLAVLLIIDGLADAQLYLWFNGVIGQTMRPDLAMRNVAQGAYVLAVLVWPASAVLRREGHNVPAALLALGVIAVMLLLGADAPAAGLAAGAVAYVLVLLLGRTGALVAGGGVVLYWLAFPWLVLAARSAGLVDQLKGALPASWDARLDIWTFAASQVAEKPLVGWGVDASRYFGPNIPLHTHSAPLQHWLELGVLGAALMAALLGWLYWRLGRPSEERSFAAIGSATLTTFVAISALSFSAWEEWWLAAGALGLLTCIALHRFWGQDVSLGGDTASPSI